MSLFFHANPSPKVVLQVNQQLTEILKKPLSDAISSVSELENQYLDQADKLSLTFLDQLATHRSETVQHIDQASNLVESCKHTSNNLSNVLDNLEKLKNSIETPLEQLTTISTLSTKIHHYHDTLLQVFRVQSLDDDISKQINQLIVYNKNISTNITPVVQLLEILNSNWKKLEEIVLMFPDAPENNNWKSSLKKHSTALKHIIVPSLQFGCKRKHSQLLSRCSRILTDLNQMNLLTQKYQKEFSSPILESIWNPICQQWRSFLKDPDNLQSPEPLSQWFPGFISHLITIFEKEYNFLSFVFLPTNIDLNSSFVADSQTTPIPLEDLPAIRQFRFFMQIIKYLFQQFDSDIKFIISQTVHSAKELSNLLDPFTVLENNIKKLFSNTIDARDDELADYIDIFSKEFHSCFNSLYSPFFDCAFEIAFTERDRISKQISSLKTEKFHLDQNNYKTVFSYLSQFAQDLSFLSSHSHVTLSIVDELFSQFITSQISSLNKTVQILSSSSLSSEFFEFLISLWQIWHHTFSQQISRFLFQKNFQSFFQNIKPLIIYARAYQEKSRNIGILLEHPNNLLFSFLLLEKDVEKSKTISKLDSILSLYNQGLDSETFDMTQTIDSNAGFLPIAKLLPKSKSLVVSFQSSIVQLVHQALFSPISDLFKGIESLPIWKVEPPQLVHSSITLPSFSIDASEHIISIGLNLLDLPGRMTPMKLNITGDQADQEFIRLVKLWIHRIVSSTLNRFSDLVRTIGTIKKTGIDSEIPSVDNTIQHSSFDLSECTKTGILKLKADGEYLLKVFEALSVDSSVITQTQELISQISTFSPPEASTNLDFEEEDEFLDPDIPSM